MNMQDLVLRSCEENRGVNPCTKQPICSREQNLDTGELCRLLWTVAVKGQRSQTLRRDGGQGIRKYIPNAKHF